VRRRWLEQFATAFGWPDSCCDCVGLWPGGGLRGQTIDQAIDRLGKTFHEAGGIAGDAGLLACFEIEPVFAFNKRIITGASCAERTIRRSRAFTIPATST